MDRRAMRSAQESNCQHSGAPSGPNTIGAVLDHDTILRRKLHGVRSVQKEIGRRFPSGDHARAEHVRPECLIEANHGESERNSLRRRARGHAPRVVYGAKRSDHIGHSVHRLQLATELGEQLLGAARLVVAWQRPAEVGLERRSHVRRRHPEEPSCNLGPRQRQAVSGHGAGLDVAGQDFAVDENAVAVEDHETALKCFQAGAEPVISS